MAITAISRDWGPDPAIVRVVTTDNLAAITANGYLTAQADQIDLVNNGAFEWVDTDYVLIAYGDGEGFFTRDATNQTFVAASSGSGLSDTLANGDIFVGNASNIATGVPVTGDVTISNTGVTTIGAASVDLAMLSAGITPSHVVKFAGTEANGGGSATVTITVTGMLNTDLAFANVAASTTAVSVQKVTPSADTITVLLSGDPGAATTLQYMVLRAAA